MLEVPHQGVEFLLILHLVGLQRDGIDYDVGKVVCRHPRPVFVDILMSYFCLASCS
jgi:hypothetical protein